MAFEDIVGHELVIDRLKSSYHNDVIPSCYLFVGQRGLGKSKLVREFAQMINCQTGEICHQCDNCKMFDHNSHPDFQIIKPSGQDIRIGQIQSLIRQLSLKPAYAQKRIVLLKDSHKLNQEAANSFLKVLEEPPLDTLIILMTSDESLLLETISSRCQKIFFSPFDRDQLENIIVENYQIKQDELDFVLNYSRGCIRKDFINKASILYNMRGQVFNMLQNLSTESMNDHCFLLEQWTKQELHGYFLEFCAAGFRDLLCVRRSGKMKLINQDMVDDQQFLKFNLTDEQLPWCFDLVIETELAIKANASRYLALESLLIQLKQVVSGTPVI